MIIGEWRRSLSMRHVRGRDLVEIGDHHFLPGIETGRDGIGGMSACEMAWHGRSLQRTKEKSEAEER